MSQNSLIKKIVPVSDSVQAFLYNSELQNHESDSGFKTICGILSNSKYIWYANGPRFEVIESRNGKRIAAWTFGFIIKDTMTKVTCVSEIPCVKRDVPLLVIGLECTLSGGIVCVFDLLSSKVLRAIQFKDQVSYVHVVDSGNHIYPILGPLRTFDGIISVGLAGGDVLLVDLCQQCIDDARVSIDDIKDELNPCQIIPLTIEDINEIEYHKQKAAELGNHLAIFLNAVRNSKLPHFILKGPKGDDRVHVNKTEVTVTSLFYCSQLGSILVGYNFGAWQIWDIINMALRYTSPIYEENVPISHFAIQEPSDDPRAFCYVWAVYSQTEQGHVGFPIAVLYSLNYEAKDFHDGYGYLYQNLQSCAVRFQTELNAAGPNSAIAKGACCLRMTSFNRGSTSRTSIQETTEDNLTICTIVWNVWHSNGIETYMSIFDLNQWYKEQMPSSPEQNCFTYLSHFCISEMLTEPHQNDILLDAYIDEGSISQFIGVQKPEEHYYPTALAYEFCICSDKNIAFIYNRGQQRALLGYFKVTGPILLLKPKDLYHQAFQLGLTPLFTEPSQSDINLHREYLLNIALEQQLPGFLCKCATIWSNGSFSSAGCSMEFFLNWAWNRANVLKTNADKLCESLFDYSELSIDANNQRILTNCVRQLSDLNRIYSFINKKIELLPNIEFIKQQKQCLDMIVVYFDVTQWLMNIELLPEMSDSMARKNQKLDSAGAPYPIQTLLGKYNERRSFLQNLSRFRKESLFFIDNLIENEFGHTLEQHWKEDGGIGSYPPPSLHSLLRTYLVENVDLIHKHSVVIYLFLDLAMILDQSRYKFLITNLIKFPAVFHISLSMIKLIQGFWHLDRGDFGTAMDLLLDPIISTPDLQLWHHRVVLNALQAQEQHNFGLLYFQVHRPPLKSIEDFFTILSLYISNHMINEAITLTRQNSSQDNEIKLLQHIFEECKKTNQIRKFISYPLRQNEEDVLMKYLVDISYVHREEFQVSYYLHRSRYIDIFQMKPKNTGFKPSGLRGQQKMSYRDNIMNTISKCFPKVARDVIDLCQREKHSLRVEVTRPKPMSVFVHNAEEQIKYKSTLIQAGILKAREIWTHPILDKSTTEQVPFMRTPTAAPPIIRKRPSLIVPRNITLEGYEDDECGVSPQKKMRPSSGHTTFGNSTKMNVSAMNNSLMEMSKFLTPIAKRRHNQIETHKTESEKLIYTPPSILKVRSLVERDSTPVNTATDISTAKNLSLASSSAYSPTTLGLTPRKPLSRSVVRFEKSNESTDDSLVTKQTETSETTIASKSAESEVFYSPNTSDKIESNDDEKNEQENRQITRISPTARFSYRDTSSGLQLETRDLNVDDDERIGVSRIGDMDIGENIRENDKEIKIQIRHRETSPGRQTRTPTEKNQEILPSSDIQSMTSSVPPSPKRSSVRLSNRKSLSRAVLENNAFSALASTGAQNIVQNKDIQSDDTTKTSSLTNFDESSVISDLDLTLDYQDLSSYVTLPKFNYSFSSSVLDDKDKEENTEPLSRRSSLRLTSRRSLNRSVLERNLLKCQASTPKDSEKPTNIEPPTSDSSISYSDELERMMQEQSYGMPSFSLPKYEYSLDSSKDKGEMSVGETKKENRNSATPRRRKSPSPTRTLSGRKSIKNDDVITLVRTNLAGKLNDGDNLITTPSKISENVLESQINTDNYLEENKGENIEGSDKEMVTPLEDIPPKEREIDLETFREESVGVEPLKDVVNVDHQTSETDQIILETLKTSEETIDVANHNQESESDHVIYEPCTANEERVSVANLDQIYESDQVSYEPVTGSEERVYVAKLDQISYEPLTESEERVPNLDQISESDQVALEHLQTNEKNVDEIEEASVIEYQEPIIDGTIKSTDTLIPIPLDDSDELNKARISIIEIPDTSSSNNYNTSEESMISSDTSHESINSDDTEIRPITDDDIDEEEEAQEEEEDEEELDNAVVSIDESSREVEEEHEFDEFHDDDAEVSTKNNLDRCFVHSDSMGQAENQDLEEITSIDVVIEENQEEVETMELIIDQEEILKDNLIESNEEACRELQNLGVGEEQPVEMGEDISPKINEEIEYVFELKDEDKDEEKGEVSTGSKIEIGLNMSIELESNVEEAEKNKNLTDEIIEEQPTVQLTTEAKIEERQVSTAYEEEEIEEVKGMYEQNEKSKERTLTIEETVEKVKETDNKNEDVLELAQEKQQKVVFEEVLINSDFPQAKESNQPDEKLQEITNESEKEENISEIAINETEKSQFHDRTLKKDDIFITNSVDNTILEKTVVSETTYTDDFFGSDIEKSVSTTPLPITDILEKSLSEISFDSEGTNRSEEQYTHEIISTVKQKRAEIKKLDDKPETPTHQRQLRKRRLSTASVEVPPKIDSPLKSTSRKRSASVDEINMSTPSTSKAEALPSKRTSKRLQSAEEPDTIQEKPRNLKNRRAASVSDVRITTSTQPKARTKRTASVSSLPVISEESKQKEKEHANEFESYSTSRRLTRSQRSLLEKAGKSSRKMETTNMPKEEIATVKDDVPSNRPKTRRSSIESTSSIASSRTTRKSESDSEDTMSLRRSTRTKSTSDRDVETQKAVTPKKSRTKSTDDKIEETIVRRTRQRSKTPDIETNVKPTQGNKKVLSKIPEEPDDTDVKEEPPVKKGRSKKK